MARFVFKQSVAVSFMLSSISRRAPSLCAARLAWAKWCQTPVVQNGFLVSSLPRFYSARNQDPLYVPFVTDLAREQASIMFWVSKNTNLKEVNVNLRVVLGEVH